MPRPQKKRKTSESDSDSSGPTDRTPQKKSKDAKDSKEFQDTDKDGNPRWHLDSKKFVTVRPFKGKIYVDIREFYEADGELRPGKKGISLNVEQWSKLKAKLDNIDEAIREKA